MVDNVEQLKKLLEQQAFLTVREVATFCAGLCDNNRGNLSVGDMIRKQFGITKPIQTPEKETKQKSHLTVVK